MKYDYGSLNELYGDELVELKELPFDTINKIHVVKIFHGLGVDAVENYYLSGGWIFRAIAKTIHVSRFIDGRSVDHGFALGKHYKMYLHQKSLLIQKV